LFSTHCAIYDVQGGRQRLKNKLLKDKIEILLVLGLDLDLEVGWLDMSLDSELAK